MLAKGVLMDKTTTVVYDGSVLQPESPLELESDKRYIVTIHDVPLPVTAGDAWDVLDALAGTLEGPVDWAGQHDHYLYGSPKRRSEAAG
jgi:hypothetical protein